MQSLRPTCNVTSCRFKAIKLLVMLGPLFGGDGPYVWPSWGKKKPKQTNKKTSEQPNGLKTSKNKAHHLQNKSLAFSRDKVRCGHTQLLPVWQGRYATQTCFPDVQAELKQSPSQAASPSAFKRALSSFRAGAEQLPVAADCLQPEQDVSHHPLCEPNTPLAHWWTNGFGVTQVLMHRVNTLQLTKSFTLVFPTL